MTRARSRSSSPNGFTFIELTIVLAVVATLIAVIAPSIGDYLNKSKIVRAEADLKTIGLTIARMSADLGQPCLKRDATLLCTKANRVDLLESEGPSISVSDVSGVDFASNEVNGSSINWDYDGGTNASMKDQFVLNTPLYLTPRENILIHPGPHVSGWRGAYVSNPVGPDPWGKKYLVNSVFLSVAIDAAGGTAEGQKSGGWSYDVFAISAGPNSLYETVFAQKGAVASGDDIIHVITGDTR